MNRAATERTVERAAWATVLAAVVLALVGVLGGDVLRESGALDFPNSFVTLWCGWVLGASWRAGRP